MNRPLVFDRSKSIQATKSCLLGQRPWLSQKSFWLSFNKVSVRLFPVILTVLLNVSSYAAQKQQPKKVDDEQTVFIELKQTDKNSNNFGAIVKTKPVKVGGKSRFNLKIHNPGTLPLEFDEAKVSCNCLSVKFSSNKIDPGKVVNAVVDYVVPRQKSEEYGINITLNLSGEFTGSLSLSGKVEGVLEILSGSALESNGVFSTWRIPILATTPIEPARLQLKMPAQFRDLEGRIETDSGKTAIIISGPEKALGVEGLVGDLIVEDPALGINASARITILKKPKLRISPKLAFFDKAEDGKYETNFLVQSVASVDSEGNGLPSPIQNIECHSGLKTMTYKATKINDSLYRVQVRFSSKSDLPDECKLKWKVVTASEIFSISTLAFFSEE